MSITRVRSNIIINFCVCVKTSVCLAQINMKFKIQDNNSDQNSWSQSNCVFCKIMWLVKQNQQTFYNLFKITLVSTYLFIFLVVLIVVISFECQLCAAMFAFEAARMKKRKIFEGSDAIYLIDYFLAPETGGLVKIRSIHFFLQF